MATSFSEELLFGRKKRAAAYFFVFFVVIFLGKRALAHCPLCTIGAAGAAGAAVWLGVSKVAVAVLIGGFSMSMGMWFSRIVKKKYVPFQREILLISVFLLTLLPIIPMFSAIGPFYIPFIGDYGRTFAVDYSFYSSLFGGAIVFFSPKLNGWIRRSFKRSFPFQGIVLTILYLLIAAAAIHFAI